MSRVLVDFSVLPDNAVTRLPLPDSYIGADAAIEGMALLTRDARRYRTWYPKLELICP